MEMKVAAAAGRLGLTLGDCRGTACRTLCAWEGCRPTGYGKPYPYNATFEGAERSEAKNLVLVAPPPRCEPSAKLYTAVRAGQMKILAEFPSAMAGMFAYGPSLEPNRLNAGDQQRR
jgi:hypothetical protein